jgi:hypothetical protein
MTKTQETREEVECQKAGLVTVELTYLELAIYLVNLTTRSALKKLASGETYGEINIPNCSSPSSAVACHSQTPSP